MPAADPAPDPRDYFLNWPTLDPGRNGEVLEGLHADLERLIDLRTDTAALIIDAELNDVAGAREAIEICKVHRGRLDAIADLRLTIASLEVDGILARGRRRRQGRA